MRHGLIVIGVLAMATMIAALARGFPNFFLEDDAYFYLRIGWNLGAGHGSTFDGLHVTNGYHLLWMGVLASVAALLHATGLDETSFVFLVCVLSVGLAVTTSFRVFRTFSERALAVLLFMLCGLTMETTLLAALVLFLASASFGERRAGAMSVAVASALVPLSRIDYFWMPLALLMVDRISSREGQMLPPRAVVLGVALGVGAHLGLERALFDAWTSVSSAYKSDISRLGGLQQLAENVGSSGNQLRYFVALTLTLIGAYGWRRHAPERSRPLLVMSLALLPLLAYSMLNDVRDWYFATPLLLVLFVTSRAWGDNPRLWQSVSVGLALLVLVAAVGYLVQNAPDRLRSRQFIADAQRHLEPADVVYQVDGAGFTGWWLDAHVVNGDGLVNSWDYRERQLANRLNGYLEETGVTHIIVTGPALQRGRLSRGGLEVNTRQLPVLADTGPTRNRLVHFQLLGWDRGRP